MAKVSRSKCHAPSCERLASAGDYCWMHERRIRNGYRNPVIADLPGEIWVSAPGHEAHYRVSNLGRIKSLERHKAMKNGVTRIFRGKLLTSRYAKNNGVYIMVELDGRMQSLHRLIAAAFLGPAAPGMQINHINGDKTDNRVDNLEYVTPAENSRHAYATGLAKGPIGRQPVNTVLTAEDVRYIRSMKGKKTQVALAEELGCSKSTVGHAMTGRNWASLR